ncbi:MAG: hypothetical protein WAM89_04245 [Terriglobales bacterium]
MEATAAKQAREQSATLAPLSTSQSPMPQASAPEVVLGKKPVGYGLPCSHCHAYYPSDMRACPICKSTERVSPAQPLAHSTASVHAHGAAGAVTSASIDEERERLLKELKSQAFASHTQINPNAQISSATPFHCVLKHQHNGENEPAAVCQTCYSDLRHQADLMEAALHMDVKEAAKIVYEAVWADTSDPNATYLNAAKALMSELQKRAGIGLLLGSNQALSH